MSRALAGGSLRPPLLMPSTSCHGRHIDRGLNSPNNLLEIAALNDNRAHSTRTL
jgi:hypothetical protein